MSNLIQKLLCILSCFEAGSDRVDPVSARVFLEEVQKMFENLNDDE